jgi:hypothetical protein
LRIKRDRFIVVAHDKCDMCDRLLHVSCVAGRVSI